MCVRYAVRTMSMTDCLRMCHHEPSGDTTRCLSWRRCVVPEMVASAMMELCTRVVCVFECGSLCVNHFNNIHYFFEARTQKNLVAWIVLLLSYFMCRTYSECVWTVWLSESAAAATYSIILVLILIFWRGTIFAFDEQMRTTRVLKSRITHICTKSTVANIKLGTSNCAGEKTVYSTYIIHVYEWIYSNY